MIPITLSVSSSFPRTALLKQRSKQQKQQQESNFLPFALLFEISRTFLLPELEGAQRSCHPGCAFAQSESFVKYIGNEL